jgi:hypothetical protein
MTFARVIDALGLPPETRVDRRVPKTLLVEHGAPTAADRRQVQEGVEEITWAAALKPANIGVPPFQDEHREYLEVAVVTMRLRGPAKAPRLIELLHRAIPYPILLVTQLPAEDSSGPVVVSFAHQRRSLNEAGAVVVEEVVDTPPFAPGAPQEAGERFLSSLNIAGLPRGDLFVLYQGWIDRVIALRTATVTGTFTIPQTPAGAAAQREALEEHQRLTAEIARLRNEATGERQTRRLVEINLELQRLEARRAETRDALAGA